VLGRGVKLGHAGTLDPAAQGLVLVLVGEATRIQHLLKDLDKEYLAEVRLGVATDTLDMEGRTVEQSEVPALDEERLRRALAALTGTRMQRPPRYSALKVKGRRAYEMARSGEEFELAERPVSIHRLELEDWQKPVLRLRACVSAGTYIRSLAREIGERLGLPATLASLERTRIGEFKLSEARKLEELDAETVYESLIPIKRLLAHLPQAEVGPDAALRLLQGKPLSGDVEPRLLDARWAVLFSTDSTKAFLCQPRDGTLRPKRLLYNDEAGDG